MTAHLDILKDNPIGILGIEFLEYAVPRVRSKKSPLLEEVFKALAFQKVGSHKSEDIHIYRQQDIQFLVNHSQIGFAAKFKKQHGPCLCSMGLRVVDVQEAFRVALSRGARSVMEKTDYDFPAIYGIGDSLIYFLKTTGPLTPYKGQFDLLDSFPQQGIGFQKIDHLTNNVPQDEMRRWQGFYESIFNFKQRHSFHIKGEKTSLKSKVVSDPEGHVMIFLNESTGEKSQVQEYLDVFRGPGVQQIALATDDLIEGVMALRERGVEFLDVPDSYYKKLPKRVPQLTKDIDQLQELKVLVEGDQRGYMLQAFTKSMIGPLFFGIIERKNHNGFGEENYQALFDARERDQKKRGFLS